MLLSSTVVRVHPRPSEAPYQRVPVLLVFMYLVTRHTTSPDAHTTRWRKIQFCWLFEPKFKAFWIDKDGNYIAESNSSYHGRSTSLCGWHLCIRYQNGISVWHGADDLHCLSQHLHLGRAICRRHYVGNLQKRQERGILSKFGTWKTLSRLCTARLHEELGGASVQRGFVLIVGFRDVFLRYRNLLRSDACQHRPPRRRHVLHQQIPIELDFNPLPSLCIKDTF